MKIDAHAHLGNDVFSNEDYYLDMMKISGVSKMVLCPGGMVDVTMLADFMRGNEPLLSLEPNNEAVKQAITSYPEKFYGFFMIDPDIHDMNDIKQAIADGFVGLKLNPLLTKINFRSALIQEVFQFSAANKVPIYTHITLNPQASIEAIREVAETIDPVIIIGHMGFSSADTEAIEVVREFDNIYLETSVGSLAAIKKAFELLGAQKLIFGSEGPAHHQKVEICKLELIGATEAEKEYIYHKNIQQLIDEVKRNEREKI